MMRDIGKSIAWASCLATCLLAACVAAQEAGEAPEPAATETTAEQRAAALLQAGDAEAAEQALAESHDPVAVAAVRRQLINAYMRKQDYASAYRVAAAAFAEAVAAPTEAQAGRSMSESASLMALLAPRADRTAEALDALDRALAALETSDEETRPAAVFALLRQKALLFRNSDQAEAAAALADELLADAKRQHAAEATDATLGRLMEALTFAAALSEDEDRSDALRAEAQAAAEAVARAAPENAQAIARFAQAALSRLSPLARSKPRVAAVELQQAKQILAELADAHEGEVDALAGAQQMLDRVEASIATALKLEEMVGQPAPPLDAAFWAHGEPLTPEQLQGKVVLLDFWAVWCGPCIATFPHLVEWQEEFGAQGLQIVGATRKYNYRWDAEAGQASRVEDENSDEAEREMLDQFMTHHQLKHPTLVTPPDSTMHADYAVTGIPHAVLIDRQGLVQMVKVGSGEETAKALHDKIVELLAE